MQFPHCVFYNQKISSNIYLLSTCILKTIRNRLEFVTLKIKVCNLHNYMKIGLSYVHILVCKFFALSNKNLISS